MSPFGIHYWKGIALQYGVNYAATMMRLNGHPLPVALAVLAGRR